MTLLTTFYPTEPYNFALLLNILSRFAHPSVEIVRDGAYWRALSVGNGIALLKVTDQGSPNAPALAVHMMAQTGVIDRQQVIHSLRHILHVEAERRDFIRVAQQREPLWEVVKPLVGMPEWRTATAFEALVKTIIEQQIAWVVALRAQKWLTEWAGERIDHNGSSFYAFPAPERIAAASINDLKPLKITFKRMALLIDVAGQVASGSLNLESLNSLPPDEAYKRLLAIKGIGHWTAVVTLERAFGHKNWVAYNDVVLQAATNRYFHGGVGRLSPDQVVSTFAPYGAFAGLAAHYTMLRWVLDVYPQQG